MTGRLVDFPVQNRRTSGYLATPAIGKGPGLLVIQEWWGLVDHIKSVTDRFAAEGFVTLAPDLYHGESTTKPDEAGRKMMALDIAGAAEDLRAAAEHVLSLDDTQPKRVAALGFCMGGHLALYGACAHPDKISAAIDFYGIHPHVKIDPSKLGGPVLAHFGKTDEFVKEADATALVDKIRTAGKAVEAHFYDAGHAFFNDGRPDAYHKPSAEAAWLRTLSFLRSSLS